MKKIIFLILVFSSALNAQTSCISNFTITAGILPPITTPPRPIFTWDLSEAVYCLNTTSKIQTIASYSATFFETGPVREFLIPNLFITNQLILNFDPIGSRAFKWRFVNEGLNEQGILCKTVTPWQNYDLRNYPY